MFALMLSLVVLAAVLVYFLPAMVAVSRNHLNAMAIFLTNLLLGWTGIGWAFAFIWAFTNNPLAAADRPRAMKLWKFILLLVLLVVVPAITVIGIKVKPANHGSATSAPAEAPAAPQPKTGVPVPADELLGKE